MSSEVPPKIIFEVEMNTSGILQHKHLFSFNLSKDKFETLGLHVPNVTVIACSD